jgi:Tfp pilus assembly protein PilX
MILEDKKMSRIAKSGIVAKNTPLPSRQKGSILIGLIITMVIMAVLAGGMVYLTTTSTFSELFSNSNTRAYYAAESGGRFASSVIRDAYANDLTRLSIINANQTYTLANGDQFQITNWNIISANPDTITFSSIGIVNSGFLASKRLINYNIKPSNQSAHLVNQTTIPVLSDLTNLPGTSDKFKITNNGTGITVTPEGGEKEVALILPTGITVTGSYSVQIKASTGVANDWMMGFLFNVNYNSVSITNALPDGYGLTFFYSWTDNGDQPTMSLISQFSSITGLSTEPPLIVLWQAVTTSGTQTFTWLAYKILKSNSPCNNTPTSSNCSLPGCLIGNDLGNSTTEVATLVVSVDRSSTTKNQIRAYYGSPTNSALGPPDNIATDDLRLAYNLWPINPTNNGTSTSNIQWPKSTASWSSTYDFFTLIKWDGINTAIATSDGSGAESDTVIGNTNFTGSTYNGIAVFDNGKSKPQVNFFDFAFSYMGNGADGSGTVIQSP